MIVIFLTIAKESCSCLAKIMLAKRCSRLRLRLRLSATRRSSTSAPPPSFTNTYAMGANIISKRTKQRWANVPKAKEVPQPPAVVAIDAPASAKMEAPSQSTDGAESNPSTSTSKANALISQLREHDDQGRIFDALSVVREIDALEREDPSVSRELEPVRHLMEETVTQADLVESLLHELHSDDDWTLAKQKSGVTVHYRRNDDSPIHTVRACSTYTNFTPKDFVRLCSLFVETELMHLWFPQGIMKPAKLLSWHSKYTKVTQLNISLGIPMISARDVIVLSKGYHLPDRNAFLIATKTILEDTCRYCEIPPPKKGVVRMATESIFYIELVQSDVISFKMIGRDDLKLKYMPSSVLNFISQGHLPFDLMKTIYRTIRNFQGSVWEEKIEERGAYYTEIEDKVYEQLKNSKEGGWGANLTMAVGEERSSPRKVTFDLQPTMPPELSVKDGGRSNVFVAGESEGKWSGLAVALLVVAALCILAPLYRRGFFRFFDMIEETWGTTQLVASLVASASVVLIAFAMRKAKRQKVKVKSILVKKEGSGETAPVLEDRSQDNKASSITREVKPPSQLKARVDDSDNAKTTCHPPRASQKRLKKVRSTLKAGLKRLRSVPSSLQVMSDKGNAGRKKAYTK